MEPLTARNGRCSDKAGSPVICGSGGRRYESHCDKDGSDWNNFRLDVPNFYGPGSNFEIDTTKPFTVVCA